MQRTYLRDYIASPMSPRWIGLPRPLLRGHIPGAVGVSMRASSRVFYCTHEKPGGRSRAHPLKEHVNPDVTIIVSLQTTEAWRHVTCCRAYARSAAFTLNEIMYYANLMLFVRMHFLLQYTCIGHIHNVVDFKTECHKQVKLQLFIEICEGFQKI